MNRKQVVAGLGAGIIAGVAFAVYVALIGMFSKMMVMISKLIGIESVGAGVVLHLVFSAIIGLIYAAIFGSLVTTKAKSVVWGLIYGLIWWVLGPLIIMPSLLGMGLQLTGEGVKMALPSLWGHLIYGLVLGLVYPACCKK
jgi:uncharacterized membrane protein YagU involved in acid resistance